MDIAELLGDAEQRGFTHNFALDATRRRTVDNSTSFGPEDAKIVYSQAVDMGTDPSDDATLYLIETTSGQKGYLIVADPFRTDPRKAAFIHYLARRREN